MDGVVSQMTQDKRPDVREKIRESAHMVFIIHWNHRTHIQCPRGYSIHSYSLSAAETFPPNHSNVVRPKCMSRKIRLFITRPCRLLAPAAACHKMPRAMLAYPGPSGERFLPQACRWLGRRPPSCDNVQSRWRSCVQACLD